MNYEASVVQNGGENEGLNEENSIVSKLDYYSICGWIEGQNEENQREKRTLIGPRIL